MENIGTMNDHVSKDKKPGPLSLLKCKCPRCRTGNMFEGSNPWDLKKTMKMRKECPVCKQPFNLEVGFYYGSSYISYALTIALSVATFAAWWVLIGFSLDDNRIFYWLIFNGIFLLALQPYLMRLARTGWLAFFVRYDRNWRTNAPAKVERTNEAHESNW
ncbi:DUF983 domain-containing protein [Filimonas effusa]|uniref:DUF983 domain-containing protein n=1 Tax=Filimonas effusa TaxID=2508721 RepID=A0A4Q1D4F0_9BACT|nr:DUF983 domain-containing protein [Filimonas effusa]RXK83218.1 DUF983 domain-containing protein [Filimonas effusa]